MDMKTMTMKLKETCNDKSYHMAVSSGEVDQFANFAVRWCTTSPHLKTQGHSSTEGFNLWLLLSIDGIYTTGQPVNRATSKSGRSSTLPHSPSSDNPESHLFKGTASTTHSGSGKFQTRSSSVQTSHCRRIDHKGQSTIVVFCQLVKFQVRHEGSTYTPSWATGATRGSSRTTSTARAGSTSRGRTSRNGDRRRTRAFVTLGREDLVVKCTHIHAKSGPGIKVVCRRDGTTGPLALPDGPVLIEGGSALDGRLVDLLVLVDVVGCAITGDSSFMSHAVARVVVSVAFHDVIFNQRTSSPAVDGKIGISIRVEGARERDGPIQRSIICEWG